MQSYELPVTHSIVPSTQSHFIKNHTEALCVAASLVLLVTWAKWHLHIFLSISALLDPSPYLLSGFYTVHIPIFNQCASFVHMQYVSFRFTDAYIAWEVVYILTGKINCKETGNCVKISNHTFRSEGRSKMKMGHFRLKQQRWATWRHSDFHCKYSPWKLRSGSPHCASSSTEPACFLFCFPWGHSGSTLDTCMLHVWAQTSHSWTREGSALVCHTYYGKTLGHGLVMV